MNREKIAAEFSDIYEFSDDIDHKFMKLSGESVINFALYIAELARKEALEEAIKACFNVNAFDEDDPADACIEAILKLKDKEPEQ